MVNLAIITEIEHQHKICLDHIDNDTTIDYQKLSEFLWLQICILDVLIANGTPDMDTVTEYMQYFDKKNDNFFM